MSKNSRWAVCLALGLALIFSVSLPLGAQAQMGGRMGSGSTVQSNMGGGTPMGNAAMQGVNAGSQTMTPGAGMGYQLNGNMGGSMGSGSPGSMSSGVMGSGVMGAIGTGGAMGSHSMGARTR